MPTYTFLNTITKEVEEHTLKISNYDKFKSENPHLERHIEEAPGCSDPVRLGLKKSSSGFRDLLKHMKSKHIRSTINDQS